MLAFNQVVFDADINGTATTYYSAGQFNDQLGSADSLVVLASWGSVGGTAPKLTVGFEHSGDGQNWIPTVGTGTPDIYNIDLNSGPAWAGAAAGLTPVLLSFVRLAVNLGGTNPTCRLKLTVTGRRF